MDSLSLPTLDEESGVRGVRSQTSSVLVVSFGDPVAQMFVERGGAGYRLADLAPIVQSPHRRSSFS